MWHWLWQHLLSDLLLLVWKIDPDWRIPCRFWIYSNVRWEAFSELLGASEGETLYVDFRLNVMCRRLFRWCLTITAWVGCAEQGRMLREQYLSSTKWVVKMPWNPHNTNSPVLNLTIWPHTGDGVPSSRPVSLLPDQLAFLKWWKLLNTFNFSAGHCTKCTPSESVIE